MIFNDTTNSSGLVNDVDFICGTDSNSFPLKDKARIMNRIAYEDVTLPILRSANGWQFDDTNKTDEPTVEINLVDGQRQYDLPASTSDEQGGSTGGAILKLLAAEVKDNSGNYHRLRRIDISQLERTITDFEETNGLPWGYDLLGDKIYLYPAPAASNVTTTNGLKLWIGREISVFSEDGSDTTTEPGFAEPFHRILSLGCSAEFLYINGSVDRADTLTSLKQSLKQEMIVFYGDRNRDHKVGISPRSHRNQREFL